MPANDYNVTGNRPNRQQVNNAVGNVANSIGQAGQSVANYTQPPRNTGTQWAPNAPNIPAQPTGPSAPGTSGQVASTYTNTYNDPNYQPPQVPNYTSSYGQDWAGQMFGTPGGYQAVDNATGAWNEQFGDFNINDAIASGQVDPNDPWFQHQMGEGNIRYDQGQPGMDFTGGYNEGMGMLRGAGDTLSNAESAVNAMLQQGYSPSQVQAMMVGADSVSAGSVGTEDVLGRQRDDAAFGADQFKSILGGDDALFNMGRLQSIDDLNDQYRNRKNALGSQLASAGFGGSALGQGMQNQSFQQHQRDMNRALLDWEQADMANRLQAGGLLNTNVGTMGGLENVQSGRFLDADKSNQAADLTAAMANQDASLQAAIANQQADLDAQGLTMKDKQFGAGYGLDAASTMAGIGDSQVRAGLGMGDMQGGMNRDMLGLGQFGMDLDRFDDSRQDSRFSMEHVNEALARGDMKTAFEMMNLLENQQYGRDMTQDNMDMQMLSSLFGAMPPDVAGGLDFEALLREYT